MTSWMILFFCLPIMAVQLAIGLGYLLNDDSPRTVFWVLISLIVIGVGVILAGITEVYL